MACHIHEADQGFSGAVSWCNDKKSDKSGISHAFVAPDLPDCQYRAADEVQLRYAQKFKWGASQLCSLSGCMRLSGKVSAIEDLQNFSDELIQKMNLSFWQAISWC